MGAQADPALRAPGYATAANWRVAYAKRLARLGVEPGYDAIVWVSGLCYAAWITGDVPGDQIEALRLVGVVLGIGLLSLVCGLLAGLYRGRLQRESLDEVIGVAIAGGLMLVPLVLLSRLLVGSQRDLFQTFGRKDLKALIPNGPWRLPQRPASRPPQLGEVAAEPIEQDGGHLVTARRIGVVGRAAAEQVDAAPAVGACGPAA